PLFYGTRPNINAPGGAGTFTTFRSSQLTAGEHNFSVSDIWSSSNHLYQNDGQEFRPDLYSGAGGNGTKIQLADLVAFFNAQGNVRMLAVGVQATYPAVVNYLVFNGTKYQFVPTGVTAPTNDVRVTGPEIALDATDYLKWHEGTTGPGYD